MKYSLILSAVLVCIVAVCAAPTKSQTESVFRKMLNNDMGKDLFTTIQLELSTSSNSNIVDTILNMLYGLQDQFEDSNENITAQVAEKEEFCGEKLVSIQVDVTNFEDKIIKAGVKLPILEQEADMKDMEVAEKQKEIDGANAKIATLQDKNEAAKAKWLERVQEHDDMREALKKAKTLISQLVSSSFLQRQPQILTQLQQHTSESMESLSKHQSAGIFRMLLRVAQDTVGIQADQSDVAEIIAIIDELLKYEDETQAVEQQAENKRLERFQFDLDRVTAASLNLNAFIADLEADSKTLSMQAAEYAADVQSWKDSKNAKSEQLELQTKTCADSQEQLKSSLENNTETLEIIQQVIDIFESSDIQDVKEVVKDIDYLEN